MEMRNLKDLISGPSQARRQLQRLKYIEVAGIITPVRVLQTEGGV